MLTIKQVESNHQGIYEGKGPVTYDQSNKVEDDVVRLFGTEGAPGYLTFGSGIIYVMNEAGATIAVYHLRGA